MIDDAGAPIDETNERAVAAAMAEGRPTMPNGVIKFTRLCDAITRFEGPNEMKPHEWSGATRLAGHFTVLAWLLEQLTMYWDETLKSQTFAISPSVMIATIGVALDLAVASVASPFVWAAEAASTAVELLTTTIEVSTRSPLLTHLDEIYVCTC